MFWKKHQQVSFLLMLGHWLLKKCDTLQIIARFMIVLRLQHCIYENHELAERFCRQK